MFKSLFRVFRIGADSSDLDKFEPIHGLPKRSLDEWLSRNPKLKKEYERELAARSQRSRAARSHRHEWAMRSWRYLVHAARSLRLLARRALLVAFVALSVDLDASLAEVSEKMLARKVHRLFVIDQDGILIGVISALDVLRRLTGQSGDRRKT